MTHNRLTYKQPQIDKAQQGGETSVGSGISSYQDHISCPQDLPTGGGNEAKSTQTLESSEILIASPKWSVEATAKMKSKKHFLGDRDVMDCRQAIF